MRQLALLLLIASWLAGGMSCGRANVISFNKLTLEEKIALEESERRVAIYDRELATFDRAHARHKISSADYGTKSDQMLLCLREETLYQNALLVRDPQLGQRALDVLRSVGTVAIAIPTYTLIAVAYVVGHSSNLHGSFSP